MWFFFSFRSSDISGEEQRRLLQKDAVVIYEKYISIEAPNNLGKKDTLDQSAFELSP